MRGMDMKLQKIQEILTETAYVRTGGSKEELQCAEYLQAQCAALGLQAQIEAFPIAVFHVTEAQLTVEGAEIPCKGYFDTGSATVEGQLCYMPNIDEVALQQCAGKIVLVDGPLGAKSYRRLVEHGAAGFISYNGDVRHPHSDIDQKELRHLEPEEPRIPGVLINAKDAVRMVAEGCKNIKITLKQQRSEGYSHNVILDLPGEQKETVLLSAHYDSTSLSQGAYDNMSGCIALLHIAEQLSGLPRRYGLRFLWCGAEERGLLGSKAYCESHELSDVLLNINLDMLGSLMGKFTAFSTADEKTKHYMECFAAEQGFPMETKFGIRSSDSNSFADHGVPAVSFVRYAPGNVATIHNRYDTAEVVSGERLLEDMEFISGFARRLVTAKQYPLDRVIAEKIKEDLDGYYRRK